MTSPADDVAAQLPRVVLFDFDGEIRVVDIQEVKKRNERTY